jgi:hypothetical protein
MVRSCMRKNSSPHANANAAHLPFDARHPAR